MPTIKIKNKETGKWEKLPTVRGKSAYEIWLEQGNTGTEQDFLDSLNGKDGYTPVKGTDYFTEADKQEMVNLVLGALPNSEEVDY